MEKPLIYLAWSCLYYRPISDFRFSSPTAVRRGFGKTWWTTYGGL